MRRVWIVVIAATLTLSLSSCGASQADLDKARAEGAAAQMAKDEATAAKTKAAAAAAAKAKAAAAAKAKGTAAAKAKAQPKASTWQSKRVQIVCEKILLKKTFIIVSFQQKNEQDFNGEKGTYGVAVRNIKVDASAWRATGSGPCDGLRVTDIFAFNDGDPESEYQEIAINARDDSGRDFEWLIEVRPGYTVVKTVRGDYPRRSCGGPVC